jgi:N-methylhydantoinase B
VFCYLASVGHWHDVGGNVPGNYNPVATECFQEGMLIPPVKLYDAGQYRPDIVAILSANSRLPGSLYGDLNGQINALELGEKRMHQLLDDYGDATCAEAFAALRASAAEIMRAEIRALPDGKVSVEDWLDNDGIRDEALKIALDMTIAGDRLTLDFSRSSPACAGPVNIARTTTVAACYVALKHIFGDVPANAGVLVPVDVVTDPASLLSVQAPKPVGGYTETILRLIDVIFQAVGQIAPDRAPACAYGTINALSMAGTRGDGRRWVLFSFFGGGHGGHSDGDGLSHGNAPISTATIPPLEILEAAYPVKFTEWALRPDSGGDGQHRGGLGAIYEIELLEEEADLFLFGERGRHPPRGANGGGDAAMNRFTYPVAGERAEPPMTSKLHGAKLRRGDRVRLETPGGGGWGDPGARDPKARMRDRDLGYVTKG